MSKAYHWHSSGFYTNIVCLVKSSTFFPPKERPFGIAGPAALEMLGLRAYPRFKLVALSCGLRHLVLGKFYFSSPPFPVRDILAVLFPSFTMSLLPPCLIRRGNEEARQAALEMHSFQLIVCAWIVLLGRFFQDGLRVPSQLVLKNTFGCLKHWGSCPVPSLALIHLHAAKVGHSNYASSLRRSL